MNEHDSKIEILIIGAGAAGLMAARELGKAGKQVIILEARDRIGGRICPIPKEIFGYEAQGGAEFVHGQAPITKSIAEKAGMTLTLTQGDMWSAENGKLIINNELVPDQDLLHQKLRELKSDMPISQFLNIYFAEEKYSRLRNSVIRLVEGYDAADPDLISTFSLRDAWLGGQEWLQYRIEEGYGALLNFLELECKKYGVEIKLRSVAREIERTSAGIIARTDDGAVYSAEKIVVTMPLPVLKDINFIPEIDAKMKIAEKIGTGNVIKILFKFKNAWWADIKGKDFSEMDFMLSGEAVSVWWTQYPNPVPVLTGWLAGPKAKSFLDSSSHDIIETSLISLVNIFKVKKEFLEEELVDSRVFNWPADPFSKGAYSYPTTESQAVYGELTQPINNKVYFAGEALYSGQDTATVEGALGSGVEVAHKILL